MSSENVVEKIASKLLVAISLTYTSNLFEESDERRSELMMELRNWLIREGLRDHLKKDEALFIFDSDVEGIIDYSWREEQVGVLGWALGHKFDLSNYKSQFELSAEEIFDDLKFLSTGAVAELSKDARLVDKSLVSEGRNFYLYLLKYVDGDLTDYAKSTLRNEAAAVFNFRQADFDADFLKTCSEDNSRKKEIISILNERYKALDWLNGLM